MDAQTLLRDQAATITSSVVITPRVPIRLFLLSDHRVLREAFARFFRSQPAILLVASKESSLNLTAEIAESACDVLLVDPVNALTLDTQFFHHAQHGLSKLRVIMIAMDASVTDITSAILSDSRTCLDLCQAEGRDRASGNG